MESNLYQNDSNRITHVDFIKTHMWILSDGSYVDFINLTFRGDLGFKCQRALRIDLD